MSDFVQSFIRAYQSGQNSRRFERLEANAIEDRDVEKELLQHRLKEIKLQERLRARAAARENLAQLSGQPEANFPMGQGEMERLNSTAGQATTPVPGIVPSAGMPKRNIPRVTIPGIPAELLGGVEIPETTDVPETLEDQMARLAMKKRMEEESSVYNIARGGRLATGTGRIIAEGQPWTSDRAPVRVPITNVDAAGRKVTTFVDETGAPIPGFPQEIEEPQPRNPIGISVDQPDGTKITKWYDPVTRQEVNLPQGVDRPAVDTTENARQVALSQSIDAATKAINDILEVNTGSRSGLEENWFQKTFIPGLDSEEDAAKRETALSFLESNISTILNSGGVPNQAGLDTAWNLVGSGNSSTRLEHLKAHLESLKKNLRLKTQNLPTTAGGPGPGTTPPAATSGYVQNPDGSFSIKYQ